MAADQLATPQDLATILQLDYASLTAAQQATLLMLVELATAKVQRAAGGQRIVDITDTAVIDIDWWEDAEYLPLPQLPVRSVSQVKLNGTVITDWSLRKQKLWRFSGWRTTISTPDQAIVTYAHGLLAGSQWLQTAKGYTLSLGALGWGNPSGASRERIDDYEVSYAEADARMQMTKEMAESIAAEYGAGAYVTGFSQPGVIC